MLLFSKRPCDEGVILGAPCPGKRCRRPALILTCTVLGSSMAFIDGTVVNIALPTLQRELGASVSGAQWVVEAYALFLAALLLVGGALGDRYGRRRMFLLGVLGFAVSSMACGLARSVEELIVARAIQGVAGAILVPSSLALLSSSFPKEERGRAIGTWSGFAAISSGIGLVLGGWILDVASWRWLFFLNVPLAAITLWLGAVAVEESRAEGPQGPLDLPGALFVTLGLAGLTWGFVEAPLYGWAHPLVVGALLGGASFLVAFLVRERFAAAPMLPLGLFRNARFAGANLLTLFLYAALAGALFLLPLVLIQVHGYDATEAGAANLPFIGLMFLLSRWSGGLVARFGPRGPLILGPLVTAVGFALIARVGVGGSYWTTFFPALFVLGLGMSLCVAPLTTTVMTSVDEARVGLASGVNNGMSRVAGVLAVALAGPIALGTFAGSLEAGLDGLEALEPAQRLELFERRFELGALEAPAELAAEVRASVKEVVRAAFVSGYRRVLTVAVGLALLASAAAAVWIRPARPVATG